jgi:hypothetical protein
MGSGVPRSLSIRWYQMIPNSAAMMRAAPDNMVKVGGSEKTNHPVNDFCVSCSFSASLFLMEIVIQKITP